MSERSLCVETIMRKFYDVELMKSVLIQHYNMKKEMIEDIFYEKMEIDPSNYEKYHYFDLFKIERFDVNNILANSEENIA